MNDNYYRNPLFPNKYNSDENKNIYYQEPDAFININDNIIDLLNANKGKIVSVYTTYCNSNECENKIFKGIIEEAKNNYIIVSDPTNGKWYIIKPEYISYIEFDEVIKQN